MAKDKLEKMDVAARRGIVEDADVDSWDSVLVRAPGGMDEVAEKLVSSGLCGVVRRDVTAEAVAGKLKEPGGKWVLLVKLRGQAWVNVAGVDYGDFDFPETLAKATKLEVMRLGYQDTAGSTYFTYYAKGKAAVDFESCGMFSDDEDDEGPDLSDTRLDSDRHKKVWLKTFEDEAAVREALVKEFEAYVPMLDAYGGKGKVELMAWHEDVIKKAGNIERVDLAVFGPAEALKESPAGDELKEAIKKGDLAAVKKAIAAGADLRFLPKGGGGPVDYAVGYVKHGEKRGQTLEIVKALLAAGADANGTKGENPPIFAALGDIGADAADVIEMVDVLLDGGADVNAVAVKDLDKGNTPLHKAAIMGVLPVAKYLVKRGADLNAKDARGRTPAKAAQEMLKGLAKWKVGDQDGHQAAAAEFLKKAEAGKVGDEDFADIGDLAAAAKRKER